MTNVPFFIVFGFISIIAVCMACYPFRRSWLSMLILTPVMLGCLVLAYVQWGGWGIWNNYLLQKAKQQQIEAMLKSSNGPTLLINQIKARLARQPKSVQGWYLLGRLYASQDQWQEARDAYLKAYQLKPNDDQLIVNYAQSLWQLNNQKFNHQIRKLFLSVLKTNPNQPDALAMLAMDSFKAKKYQEAVDYWQRLLKLIPPESADAIAIQRAIAKAKKQLN